MVLVKKEIWRRIRGFKGKYLVSTRGRVFSYPKAKLLKPTKGNHGYFIVGLVRPRPREKAKSFLIHRLVAEAFIPNPCCKPEVNHRNGVKTNNVVTNLEWVTQKENSAHSAKLGMHPYGSRHGSSKLTEEEVDDIADMIRSGFMLRKIAAKYDVLLTTISKIKRGVRWAHRTGFGVLT